MTRKELEHVKKVLQKIQNPPADVALAIAHCDKDLALRDMQSKRQKENMEEPYLVDGRPW